MFTMHADDTTLSFETDDLQSSIIINNIEFNKVSHWLYSNYLTLNVLKTHSMRLHKPKANPPDSYTLSMGGSSIGRVIEVKSLGVGLDPCSRFHLHIREVVKMLSKTVPIIYRIKSTLNALCLKILHYAIIYPNIFYCASVWAGTCKSIMNPVFIAHKEIIRAILGITQRTSSCGLFQELGIMELIEILKHVTVIYVFRSQNNPNLDEFSLR